MRRNESEGILGVKIKEPSECFRPAEVGIYKRKQESKNERKHATTKNATKKKKEKMITVKKKKKENTLSTKKVRFNKKKTYQEKEGSKWKTQIRMKHFFFS